MFHSYQARKKLIARLLRSYIISANAYTDIPWTSRLPYCLEASTSFAIEVEDKAKKLGADRVFGLCFGLALKS